MNLSNYYCDHAGCSNVARVFGIGMQSTKSKACGDHALDLIGKHMSVYDISGFTFIDSAEDAALYMNRKEQVVKGLGNLSTLESRYNTDLEVARNRLQSRKTSLLALVERVVHEMQLATCLQFEELKQKLQQSHSHLQSFLTNKDFHLSPEDTTLCSDVHSPHGVGLVLGDCSLAVAKAVMESFFLLPFEGDKMVSFAQEQIAKGRLDLAKEACDYVQNLGLSSLCPDIDSASLVYSRKAERKLIELLPNASTDHEVQMVVDTLIASSMQASQVSNYTKSLRKLMRGRDILHSKKQESPTICRDHGFALARFGKWGEADSVYRRGLELQLDLGQSSELALQLNNGLIEAYYQSAKLQEAVSVCKYVLEGWSRTPHTFEMLRTVYFLASSYYYLEQHANGFALVDAWQGVGVDSARSACVLGLILAEKMRLQKSKGAIAFNEQAVAQSMQQLPSSFMTAQALRNLGRIFETQQQLQRTEECYLQACQIFSMHFPHSFSYAQCLENCGYLYQNLVNSPDQAEKYYKDAYDILKQHYAETKAFAYCLLNLGLLSAGKGRKEEAIQYLEKAMELHRKMGDQESQTMCELALSGLRG